MANDNVSALLAMAGGGSGGGGGSVTPASIVSATGDMTAQQAADTLGNIGGEPEKLVVNVVWNGGIYSADKTFAEIRAALDAKKTVVCQYSSARFTLYEIEDYLAFVGAEWLGDSFRFYQLNINDDDSVFLNQCEYSLAAKTVTVSGTTPTIATAAGNTIYECGEITSLTVTAIANPGDFIIRFTSGATATTTNFPASMVFPEAFSAEANMRYEINVSNGYALAVGWPTT